MKNMKKTLLRSLFVLAFVFAAAAVFQPAKAEALTVNQYAHRAYRQQITKIEKGGYVMDVGYCYHDMDNNDVDECIMVYKYSRKSGTKVFRIYKYNDGKTVCMLNTTAAGMKKLYSYKTSKGFLVRGKHNGETWYKYYRLVNGKYKLRATKRRTSGGSWKYYLGASHKTGKTHFTRRIRGIRSGYKTTVTIQ